MARYISSLVRVSGDEEQMRRFQEAFEKEGFDVIKKAEEHLDEKQTHEWRINNWGMPLNVEERYRIAKEKEGKVYYSLLTYGAPPRQFVERASVLFGLCFEMTSSNMNYDYFMHYIVCKGEVSVDVYDKLVSEAAIDYYGEDQYIDELEMTMEFYLGDGKVDPAFKQQLLEKLEEEGIKKLLLNKELLFKKMCSLLPFMESETIVSYLLPYDTI